MIVVNADGVQGDGYDLFVFEGTYIQASTSVILMPSLFLFALMCLFL